jgi:signal transduction histidine kinase
MNERSELLNGRLQIESSGDGTTVYVTIPIANEKKMVPQPEYSSENRDLESV